jgi:hypothetical protein
MFNSSPLFCQWIFGRRREKIDAARDRLRRPSPAG